MCIEVLQFHRLSERGQWLLRDRNVARVASDAQVRARLRNCLPPFAAEILHRGQVDPTLAPKMQC